MSDELPPYEGQNWLCLTDAELRQLSQGPEEWPMSVSVKVQHLVEALGKRLAARAQLQPAEVITARTDRGGLLKDEESSPRVDRE